MEVTCQFLPASSLTNTKPAIKVVEPMVKEGGLFSSKSVSYVLETKPFDWKVQRSYKDVLWLREQLQKEFPGHIVLP